MEDAYAPEMKALMQSVRNLNSKVFETEFSQKLDEAVERRLPQLVEAEVEKRMNALVQIQYLPDKTRKAYEKRKKEAEERKKEDELMEAELAKAMNQTANKFISEGSTPQSSFNDEKLSEILQQEKGLKQTAKFEDLLKLNKGAVEHCIDIKDWAAVNQQFERVSAYVGLDPAVVMMVDFGLTIINKATTVEAQVGLVECLKKMCEGRHFLEEQLKKLKEIPSNLNKGYNLRGGRGVKIGN